MSKAGTITSEQATELIEALANEQKNPKKEDSAGRMGESLDDMIRTAISSSMGGAFSKATYSDKTGDNSVHLSRFERPTGGNFTFSENKINVASVSDIKMDHAKMQDNSINASRQPKPVLK